MFLDMASINFRSTVNVLNKKGSVAKENDMNLLNDFYTKMKNLTIIYLNEEELIVDNYGKTVMLYYRHRNNNRLKIT